MGIDLEEMGFINARPMQGSISYALLMYCRLKIVSQSELKINKHQEIV